MAGIWVWIIGYAVALVALQALVYYYYLRQDEGTSLQASTATGERPPSGKRRYPPPAPEESVTDTQDGRHCRHCGAVNETDTTFRYCRECGSDIGR